MGAAVDSLDPVVDGATQKSELTRNKSSSVNSETYASAVVDPNRDLAFSLADPRLVAPSRSLTPLTLNILVPFSETAIPNWGPPPVLSCIIDHRIDYRTELSSIGHKPTGHGSGDRSEANYMLRYTSRLDPV
ncbi:hypothetical protein Leryth_022793 [Lithospermum erythrorhizon]|nr:hypothetical protein Leryth_022793 [Lithospermum erythrorhizon]